MTTSTLLFLILAVLVIWLVIWLVSSFIGALIRDQKKEMDKVRKERKKKQDLNAWKDGWNRFFMTPEAYATMKRNKKINWLGLAFGFLFFIFVLSQCNTN